MEREQSPKTSRISGSIGKTKKSQKETRYDEVVRFLLAYAKKKGIRVKQTRSESDGLYFCRLENLDSFSTAVSAAGENEALVMAFLSFLEPEFKFPAA